jgi:hypothetical protein
MDVNAPTIANDNEWARTHPLTRPLLFGDAHSQSDTENPRRTFQSLEDSVEDVRTAAERIWDAQITSITAISRNAGNTSLDDRIRDLSASLVSGLETPSRSEQLLEARRSSAAARMGTGNQRRRRGWGEYF